MSADSSSTSAALTPDESKRMRTDDWQGSPKLSIDVGKEIKNCLVKDSSEIENVASHSRMVVGSRSIEQIWAMQDEAMGILHSPQYKAHVFNPHGGFGFHMNGTRLEMYQPRGAEHEESRLYYVCVESLFRTGGSLGLKLTMCKQGWLMCNSGDMVTRNEHLSEGIDFFVDDILVSVNGFNLLGLDLSEVVNIIVATKAPRKVVTCRLFKSISGAMAWMLQISDNRSSHDKY